MKITGIKVHQLEWERPSAHWADPFPPMGPTAHETFVRVLTDEGLEGHAFNWKGADIELLVSHPLSYGPPDAPTEYKVEAEFRLEGEASFKRCAADIERQETPVSACSVITIPANELTSDAPYPQVYEIAVKNTQNPYDIRSFTFWVVDVIEPTAILDEESRDSLIGKTWSAGQRARIEGKNLNFAIGVKVNRDVTKEDIRKGCNFRIVGRGSDYVLVINGSEENVHVNSIQMIPLSENLNDGGVLLKLTNSK